MLTLLSMCFAMSSTDCQCLFTYGYPSLLVYTYVYRVYLCLLVLTNVYSCLPVFTLYLCLPPLLVFTYVHPCFPMFSSFYPVYLCTSVCACMFTKFLAMFTLFLVVLVPSCLSRSSSSSKLFVYFQFQLQTQLIKNTKPDAIIFQSYVICLN